MSRVASFDENASEATSLAERCAAISHKYAVSIVCFLLGLTSLSVLLIATGMEFQLHALQYRKSNTQAAQSQVFIFLDAPDIESREAVLAELELLFNKAKFTNVLTGLDFSPLRQKALHYVPEETLSNLSNYLQHHSTALQQVQSLETVMQSIQEQLTSQSITSPELLREQLQQLQAAGERTEETLQNLNEHELKHSVSSVYSALNNNLSLLQKQLFVSENQRGVWVQLDLQKSENNTELQVSKIQKLQQLVQILREKYPRTQVLLTGPAITAAEQETWRLQSLWQGLVLGGLVALFILCLALNHWRSVAAILLTLTLGWACHSGCLTFLIGHYTFATAWCQVVLTVWFFALLLRVQTEYLEIRKRGDSPVLSWTTTLLKLGGSCCLLTLSVSMGFLSLLLNESAFWREIGITFASGIPLFTFMALCVHPAVQTTLSSDSHESVEQIISWLPMVALTKRAPWGTCFVVALLCIGALAGLKNIAQLKSSDANSVSSEFENYVEHMYRKCISPLTVACDSVEQAQDFRKQIASIPGVLAVENDATHFPVTSAKKQQAISQLAAYIEDTNLSHARYIGHFDELEAHCLNLQKVLPREYLTPELKAYFLRWMRTFQIWKQRAKQITDSDAWRDLQSLAPFTNAAPPELNDLSPCTSEYIANEQGQFLLKVHTRSNVLQGALLRKFMNELQQVAPHIGGTKWAQWEAEKREHSQHLQAIVSLFLVIEMVLLLLAQQVSLSFRLFFPLILTTSVSLGIWSWMHHTWHVSQLLLIPAVALWGMSQSLLFRNSSLQTARYTFSIPQALQILSCCFVTSVMCLVWSNTNDPHLAHLGSLAAWWLRACALLSLFGIPAWLHIATRSLPEAITSTMTVASPNILLETLPQTVPTSVSQKIRPRIAATTNNVSKPTITPRRRVA